MMTNQHSSDGARGVFVSVDGPGGAGKTTIVRHLAQLLAAEGQDVHVTAEPSSGPIGVLAAELTETVTGHALACLYTADRYYHVETEILPALDAGRTVVSDRYLASGLVVQRFDGVDPVFLWNLNEHVHRPDLAVILDADSDVIAERLSDRGPHNRFQHTPGSSLTEVEFYRHAADAMAAAGFTVLRVYCSDRSAAQSAALIAGRLTTLSVQNRVAS
ncbi:dTMP kinase [Umezawaea tangerina]|uniref:Thymidylate kinase n=1 Tax=Umezawaea tangerina TaxID=84725 RepID=A0A2T0S6Y7_9PSEU|nr:dTMP kinase [Umezawaea tangerina]PRY29189.1 dTMP kinase [Umezawaea tangerina]